MIVEDFCTLACEFRDGIVRGFVFIHEFEKLISGVLVDVCTGIRIGSFGVTRAFGGGCGG